LAASNSFNLGANHKCADVDWGVACSPIAHLYFHTSNF